jgi:hypothetical protein
MDIGVLDARLVLLPQKGFRSDYDYRLSEVATLFLSNSF